MTLLSVVGGTIFSCGLVYGYNLIEQKIKFKELALKYVSHELLEAFKYVLLTAFMSCIYGLFKYICYGLFVYKLIIFGINKTTKGKEILGGLPLPFLQSKKKVFKSILITGATSGLGQYLAQGYAKKYKGEVFLALSGRKEKVLKEIAKTCEDFGAKTEIGIIDVTNGDELQAWIKEMDQKYELDLVIANAGINGSIQPKERSHEDKTKKLFDVNVTGVFDTIYPVIESFKKRKSGQIAVVSSLAGYATVPRGVSYSATKAALAKYSKGMRDILRFYNVGFTCINPGYVESGMVSHSIKEGKPAPLLMKTESAAHIIMEGLENNDGVIAFPLPTYIAANILHAAPQPVYELIMYLSSNSRPVWKEPQLLG